MKNILFAIFVAALVLPLQAGSYQWRYCYYSSCEQKASIKATLDSDMMKRLADTNNLLYIGYDEAYVPAVKQGGKGNKLSSKYKYSVNKSSFKCSVKYSAKNQKLVSKMSSKNDDDGLWIWVGNRDYYYDDYYYDNSYAIPTSFKVTSTGILKEPIEMSGENYRFDHEFETMEYPYGFQLALEGKNYVYNGQGQQGKIDYSIKVSQKGKLNMKINASNVNADVLDGILTTEVGYYDPKADDYYYR